MGTTVVDRSEMKVNRIIRKMDHSIFELVIDGVDVIKRKQVVNEEKWKEYCKVQEDLREAAKASMYAAQEAKPIEVPDDRISKVEKDVQGLSEKMDTIISLMQSK